MRAASGPTSFTSFLSLLFVKAAWRFRTCFRSFQSGFFGTPSLLTHENLSSIIAVVTLELPNGCLAGKAPKAPV